MARVPRAGTNSSPSLVLRRTQIRPLGPDLDHRPLAHLNPLHPRIPSPNKEPILLPPGRRHRLVIAIAVGLQRGAIVEVAFSVWLGICCIHWLVGTQAMVQCLLVLALVLALYPEAGNPALALVPNLEIGRLIPGANPLNPTMGRTRALDQRALHRHITIGYT